MKKISIPFALALLKRAGVKVAEIVTNEADATADANEEEMVAEIDASRKEILKPQILAEEKTATDKAVKARIQGTMAAFVKRTFGLKQEDLEGLDEDKMLQKGLETLKATDADSIRAQMKEMAETHAAAIKTLTETKDAEIRAAHDRYTERDIDAFVAGIVKEIPRHGGDDMMQAVAYKQYLRANYNLVWNEEKQELELREKANAENPAWNETKTKQLTAKDLATPYFTNLGLVKTDNRNLSAAERMRQQQQQNQQQQQQQRTNPADGQANVSREQQAADKLSEYLDKQEQPAA